MKFIFGKPENTLNKDNWPKPRKTVEYVHTMTKEQQEQRKRNKYEKLVNKIPVGEGWVLYAIPQVYSLNNGEFNVTADIVNKKIGEFGKDYVKSWYLIPILNWFYREHNHLYNSEELLVQDITLRIRRSKLLD